jgi:Fe-S-cluster-containing dehydrogenase component
MSTRKDFSKDATFLIDMTKCTGCRACQVACKQWNQLEAEETEFFSGEGYQESAGHVRIHLHAYQVFRLQDKRT